MSSLPVYYVANALWKVVEKLGLSYRNANELNAIIDKELPGHPAFTCWEFSIRSETLQFHHRDILECIRALYGDSEFTHDLVFVPKHHYADCEWTCQVYSDMHTGDWWWAVQVHDLLCALVQVLMACVEVSQVVATGSYSDPSDPIIRQDSADPFLWESSISCVYDDRQHSKGNTAQIFLPHALTDWLYSSDQTGRHCWEGSSALCPHKHLSCLHANHSGPNH
jgi:hypothetical protein